jgi:hypothetical protein
MREAFDTLEPPVVEIPPAKPGISGQPLGPERSDPIFPPHEPPAFPHPNLERLASLLDFRPTKQNASPLAGERRLLPSANLSVFPGNDNHNLGCSIRFLAHTRGRSRPGEIRSN